MNLILFEPAELARPLSRKDPRARHILEVLRRSIGDALDVGLINGPRGRATLAALTEETLTLTFAWEPDVPPVAPITLVVGLPRPQTARDILRDATTLGVAAIHFVRTEKSEPGYAQSTLWSSGEWRRHVLTGAEQAFDTRVPEIAHGATLATTLANLPRDGTRIAFDNYESPRAFSALPVASPLVLALGSERGWSAADRDTLRAQGFALAHLGPRVLRAETAVVAALTLARAKLGLM